MTGSRLATTAVNAIVRMLLLVLGINFINSALAIAAGDFDAVALPSEMMTMEFWANLFSGIGWMLVLVLSFRRRSVLAPALAVFLAGAFLFDVLTTWPLALPLPPGFLYWGSAVVCLQLLCAAWLARRQPS